MKNIIEFSKIFSLRLVVHIFIHAEFIRIGYYVSNDYMDPELKENNPKPPQMDKLQRNILATNPR